MYNDQPKIAGDKLVLAPSNGRVIINAKLLKSLRTQKALSQDELAYLLGQKQLQVSLSSIKRAEAGKPILLRIVRQLASFFDVSVQDLLNIPVLVANEVSPTSAKALTNIDSELQQYVVIIAINDFFSLNFKQKNDIRNITQRFGGKLRTDILLPSDGNTRSNTNFPLLAYFGDPKAYQNDIEQAILCAQAIQSMLANGYLGIIFLDLVKYNELESYPPTQLLSYLKTPSSNCGACPQVPIYLSTSISSLISTHHFSQLNSTVFDIVNLSPAPTSINPNFQDIIVGRYSEIYQFKGIIESVNRTASGHVIYIRGNAGIGKTRLSLEFENIFSENNCKYLNCKVHNATIASFNGRLVLLAQLLRGLVQQVLHCKDWSASLISDLLSLGEFPLEWGAMCHLLANEAIPKHEIEYINGLSYADRERYTQAIFEKLIILNTQNQPLLLIIEDIHWGDERLFNLLCKVIINTHAFSVIWVLTSRYEQDPFEQYFLEEFSNLSFSLFNLAGLKAPETEIIASQFTNLACDYRQSCIEKAQGNPLFLIQLLINPHKNLPESLKHLIQLRLSSLAILDRQVLMVASVLGSQFNLDALQAIIQHPNYIPKTACRYHILKIDSEKHCHFVHDIVRLCIYDSIGSDTLQSIHQQIAQYFFDRDHALCAHHLLLGHDPRALTAVVKALNDKMAAFQFESALQMCALYRQHCASLPLMSSEFFLLEADAYSGLGENHFAKESYTVAYLQAGQSTGKILAALKLARTLNILDLIYEEEVLLDEILPLVINSANHSHIAQLHNLKGNIEFLKGGYEQCRLHHRISLSHAQDGMLIEAEAIALSGLGDSYYAQGQMNKAHELFRQCIGLCRAYNLQNIEAANLFALGTTKIYLGQYEEAIECANHSIVVGQKVGHHRAEIMARLTLVWVLIATNQLDQALNEVDLSLVLSRRMGSVRFEIFTLESYARILFMQNKHNLAMEQINLAAQAVRRDPNLQKFIGPWIMGTLALIADCKETKALALQNGVDYLNNGSLAHNAFRFLVTACEIALLDNDLDSAQEYLLLLSNYGNSNHCVWVHYYLHLFQQYLLWLKSPDDEIRYELSSLIKQAKRYGFCYVTPALYSIISGI